jgi:hypothetical protein
MTTNREIWQQAFDQTSRREADSLTMSAVLLRQCRLQSPLRKDPGAAAYLCNPFKDGGGTVVPELLP